MITQKKKICLGCEESKIIFSRGYCLLCSKIHPKQKTSFKDKVKKPVVKATGELALFQTIWATRPHKCSVCDANIPEFDTWVFSHVLSKGAFPRFRLYDKNIVIKCRDHHRQYETTSNKDLAKIGGNWLPIIDLHDSLVQEYYNKNGRTETSSSL